MFNTSSFKKYTPLQVQIGPDSKMLPRDEHVYMFTDEDYSKYEVKPEIQLLSSFPHLLNVCRR